MEKISLVFLATPDIAIESFKFFINSPDYDVLALVTQKAKAQNRGKKVVERNIVKIAKEKGNAIKEKSEELVELAVAKGTPVLQKAAEEVRIKTTYF